MEQRNANLRAICDDAREYLADCYRSGHERGMRARLSERYTHWSECADEHTHHGLYGFMDGFENKPRNI